MDKMEGFIHDRNFHSNLCFVTVEYKYWILWEYISDWQW